MTLPRPRILLPLAVAAALIPLGPPAAHAGPENPPAANYESGTVPIPGPGGPVGFSNGQNATVQEYPAIIAGLREGGSRPQGQSCTGSAVAPRKILIAAHCADAAGEKSFLYGLDDLNAGGGFRTRVIEYKKHPRYVTFDQGYDVAVVTVADDIPVPGGVYAQVATSADERLAVPGRDGVGYGYGKKDFNDTARDVTLDKATLPVVDGERLCQGVGAGFKAATMICAGYGDGRVSILPGDSGGPLIIDGKIVGVASWSRADFKWYSVYGRLTNDMGDWVKEQIGGQQPGEFGLSLSPAGVRTTPGRPVSATVVSTASGAPESVTLSAAGLPAGARAVFQPTSIMTGDTAGLTVETSASTPVGTSPITVTATNAAGRTAHATLTLTVEGDPPTGEVKVTLTPPAASVRSGMPATTSATATGGAGKLTLSLSGLPAGVHALMTPTTVPQGGRSSITLLTGFSQATPPGTYPIVLRASAADGKSGTATFTLTVRR
ncbi:trypsin-like serine protease [Nonomuraea sp. NPDC050547]|uniref:trypsin-like serine protease n=1 Tax=Nonomuraea sp. NPDC050547 TaxID=3364368 RepID=UPI0037A6A215